ncbi:STAS domain-containing protein [Streptomyces sp. A1547]|uniref:STAS domain-containing protein n=1 Tax=Streptomyces sp. A1547 TaxID=2563105 RepID=UPI00109E3981|nr:STAS domain-containing protein [Streptomyces sp. A1547]THA39715.1 STAS domain-containing protein [Streptomyces sp. A1547]
MINVDVQYCGSSVLVSADGELNEDAGEVLQHTLDHVTADERDLLLDLHGVAAMDADGLFHLLNLHRRAERLGLRVLVTGWQPQPQQRMAEVAGILGARAATGERYALASFRRLLEERAQRARDQADFASGWLPRA